MPNVKEILIGYLTANGYQGLCNDGCECGIADLMPCSGIEHFRGIYIDSCEPSVAVNNDNGKYMFKQEKVNDSQTN